MNKEKIREDFEKSYLGGNKHMGRRNEHGDYVLPSIQDAWGGWRAAYELTQAFMEAADAARRHAEFELIDAKRWRHARKLLTIDDIEGAQGAFDSFGGLVSEHECLRADAAIDAAMTGK